jgi:hypothetical protein
MSRIIETSSGEELDPARSPMSWRAGSQEESGPSRSDSHVLSGDTKTTMTIHPGEVMAISECAWAAGLLDEPMRRDLGLLLQAGRNGRMVCRITIGLLANWWNLVEGDVPPG